jgi:hypothetical protein
MKFFPRTHDPYSGGTMDDRIATTCCFGDRTSITNITSKHREVLMRRFSCSTLETHNVITALSKLLSNAAK